MLAGRTAGRTVRRDLLSWLYDGDAGIAIDDPCPGASLEPSAPGLRSSRPLGSMKSLIKPEEGEE
jgi:hypothetical protein